MNSPSERQLTYIENLKKSYLDRQEGQYIGIGTVQHKMMCIVNYALTLALPAPQTTAEASEQIDALKYGMMDYARRHQEWSQPVLARIAELFGDGGENRPDDWEGVKSALA